MDAPTSSHPLWNTFLFLFCAFVYFLPTIAGRHKHNASAIALLNLFLGWTVLGWIIALVWAASNDAPAAVVVRAPAAPHTVASLADELGKLRQLRDEGTLNETEFLRLRERLLSQSV